MFANYHAVLFAGGCTMLYAAHQRSEARAGCQRLGGDLVSFDSAGEEEFVKTVVLGGRCVRTCVCVCVRARVCVLHVCTVHVYGSVHAYVCVCMRVYSCLTLRPLSSSISYYLDGVSKAYTRLDWMQSSFLNAMVVGTSHPAPAPAQPKKTNKSLIAGAEYTTNTIMLTLKNAYSWDNKKRWVLANHVARLAVYPLVT